MESKIYHTKLFQIPIAKSWKEANSIPLIYKYMFDHFQSLSCL